MNDVILAKKVSVERCLNQIRSYYQTSLGIPFGEDHMRRDAIALNIQRAAEQTIDIANHLIKTLKLGLPQQSRDSFVLLADAGIISQDLSIQLQRMVSFRNILIHEYKRLNLDIMVDVIENHLDDLQTFADIAVAAS